MAALALGFAVWWRFVLREVPPRYVESMRRALTDTAALPAVILEVANRLEGAMRAVLGLPVVWAGGVMGF